MAISLSELTGASTSGNVLNEVNSYADFLDSCPRLVNKADPSGATDAVQTVATKQPIALPLIDGEGYLFSPQINGNGVAVDMPSIGANDDFVVELDGVISNPDNFHITSGSTAQDRLLVNYTYNPPHFFDGTTLIPMTQLSEGRHTLTVERTNNTLYLKQDGVVMATRSSQFNTYAFDFIGFNGQYTTSGLPFYGAIKTYKLSINGTEQLNIDFTSPRIPHGATEFTCETGQVVTVNTSGNNPSKVIKKPVLRFDGVNSSIRGWFTNNLTSGYMFAAFTVNGDGGGQWGRVFSVNLDGSGTDYDGAGAAFSLRSSSTTTLRLLVQSGDVSHLGMFDDANGDILHETKLSDDLSVLTKVNDANSTSVLHAGTIDSDRFNIGSNAGGSENTSIDLEYLALFPATLSDSQADQIRNYINNRNKVFTLIDSQGYYFFDGAATDDGQVFTGSGSWNGRIVGSDNGDSDFYISQNTLDDRPTTDGYKITFADNTDHFDIPSTSQAGWQIVGTSRGTFAYKVNDNAVTELNLLGNAGGIRTIGDLYGIILLPESATNRDIEEARKLLIDRGASDASSGSSYFGAWYERRDIVNFKASSFPDTTNLEYAWENCVNLSNFGTLNAPYVTSFYGTWRNAYALTQFPQDSKLGTEVTGTVDFEQAWKSSGLQSFPALDLSKGNNFTSAWQNCSSLTQFPQDAKLGTEVTGANCSSAWRSSGLTSFNTPLPTAVVVDNAWRATSLTDFAVELPEATSLNAAWYQIGILTKFSVPSLPKAKFLNATWFATNITSFNTQLPKAEFMDGAWLTCYELADFSADVLANWNPVSISSGVFHRAWQDCTSLTAQSVENILVPIANSGKWATNDGTSGGTALTDATIDIDYDVTTGSLTAATLSAIETLNGRGWSVNINNEIIVPNILQLQPAAAYSLRSFDSDADPTVVNVRRSSDGSLSDFTASQVSDGTLEAWVGSGNDGYVTTFYDQSTNGNNSTQSTASEQPLIVQNGVLVTENGEAALSFLNDSNNLEMPYNDLSNQARLDSYYVTQHAAPDNNFVFPSNSIGKSGYIAQLNSPSTGITDYPSASLYTNSTLMTGNTRGDVWNAQNGYKLIVHDNGSTTGWGNNNIYFGQNGAAAGTYSFTGKLQEMIFFNTDQSANRVAIQNNINDHFGIY